MDFVGCVKPYDLGLRTPWTAAPALLAEREPSSRSSKTINKIGGSEVALELG